MKQTNFKVAVFAVAVVALSATTINIAQPFFAHNNINHSVYAAEAKKVEVEATGGLTLNSINPWGGFAGYNLSIKVKNPAEVKAGDYFDIKFKGLTGTFVDSLRGVDVKNSDGVNIARTSQVSWMSGEDGKISQFIVENKNTAPMSNWTLEDFSSERVFRVTFNENAAQSDEISIKLSSNNIYNPHPRQVSRSQDYSAQVLINDIKITEKIITIPAMGRQAAQYGYSFSGGVLRYSTNKDGEVSWMESSNVNANELAQIMSGDRRFSAGDVFTFEFIDESPLWKVIASKPVGSHQLSCDTPQYLYDRNILANSNNNGLLMGIKNGCIKYTIKEVTDRKFTLVIDEADSDYITLGNPFFVKAIDNVEASILNADGTISAKPVNFRSELVSATGERKWFREGPMSVAIEKRSLLVEGEAIFSKKPEESKIEEIPEIKEGPKTEEIKAPNTGAASQGIVAAILSGFSTMAILTAIFFKKK